MKRLFFRHQPLIMSISAGVLLALSWPARGVPVLIFVALLPLLWVEDHFYHRRHETRIVGLFVHAWLAFFVFNLFTTWWIVYATLPGMLVAVLLNPVFMALPWLLMHLARRVLPGRQGQASLVVLWLTFEYLHAMWDLNWSWLDLGNVFATVPALVQWYAYTGVAGGTAWVLVVNLMLYALWKAYAMDATGLMFRVDSPGEADRMLSAPGDVDPGRRRRFILRAGLTASALVVPVIISLVIWFRYEEVYDPVEVVVIQPSHDPYDRIEQLSEAHDRVHYMMELADSKITPQTRFVVAPEGANPRGIWIQNDEEHFTVKMLRSHIDRHPGLIWVLGSFTYRLYAAGEPRPSSASPYMRDDYVDAYNSAVMIEAGMPVSYHHKSKLVPGIERMPFYRYIKPLGRLVERFGGIQTSLGTQDHREVFRSASGQAVVPAVCYESVYGHYMAGYIRNGGGLIFIVTNDGWWRHTAGHRQHHHYARLRAIESRRSIARSASTGISSFINQKGEVLQQTGWWEATAISHEINQNDRPTFYTLQGNFLGKLSLFLTALLLAYMLSQRIIRKG
jgi:apolipoprotein N-acyltransferase